MNIVFIHGMNQQNETAQSLKQHWLNLILQGLITTQLTNLFPYFSHHFRMPFYGDLLSRHHLNNRLNASTLLPQALLHTSQSNSMQYKPHRIKNQRDTFTTDSNHTNKGIQQELHLLAAQVKDFALHDLSLLINDFPKLHIMLLKKFLVESYLYLSNPHFIHAVHMRIHEQLHHKQANIIVAHSLGSVIAYHFLLLHPELNIHRFITLGSPLAFQVIHQNLPQPLARPSAISGDWINFYSHDDFLSAIPLESSPFDFKPAIINQQIRTSIEHPHAIEGYLQHNEIIQSLVHGLKNTL